MFEPPAPKAWFLGPKAENQEFFERMLLEAFRDYCYWRRNFHPEDQAGLHAADRLRPEFMQYQESLHDQLFEMLSQLKRSMPFFSPRYLGHMAKDLLSPGLLGYLAALFYNQNNVTREAAPITSRFESEALQGLATMLGYDPARAWGHLCAGGTLANIEALWTARSLRLLPFQLALAQSLAPEGPRAALTELLADLPSPARIGTAQALALQARLPGASAATPGLQTCLDAVSPNRLGLTGFQRACRAADLGLPPRLRVAYSQNAHYSLRKALALLGLGEDAALRLPLDAQLRLDTTALETSLAQLGPDEHLLAVVGVYGSTEEGAIDDFERLAELAAAHGFWLHGDACYGGYALALRAREPEPDPVTALQDYLRGPDRLPPWDREQCRRWLSVSDALSRCDSLAIDPHKLGYLPYPAGAVFYREHQARELIRCEAPYLNDVQSPGTADPETPLKNPWQTPYPGHYTLEGSRPGATSAALWLAQRTVSLDRQGHGQLVAGTLRGAAYLRQLLSETIPHLLPGLVCGFLCTPPDLNLLCYTFSGTWQGERLGLKRINQLIEGLYQQLLSREDPRSQDFVVSMTRLEAGSYGQERLQTLWRRLAPGSDFDDGHIALLRTVVMDPFLPEARTRSADRSGFEPLAEGFAQVLADQVEAALARTAGLQSLCR